MQYCCLELKLWVLKEILSEKSSRSCSNYAIFNSQHFLNAICSMQLIWLQFILMKHFNSTMLCNKKRVAMSTTLIKIKVLVVVWRKLCWVAPGNWEGLWCFFLPLHRNNLSWLKIISDQRYCIFFPVRGR